MNMFEAILAYVAFIFILAIVAKAWLSVWHLVDRTKRETIIKKLKTLSEHLMPILVYVSFLSAGVKICWDALRGSGYGPFWVRLLVGAFGGFCILYGATFSYKEAMRWKHRREARH
jgi:hypothetical protein